MLRPAAVLLATVLLLAGCGDDGEEPTAASGTTEATASSTTTTGAGGGATSSTTAAEGDLPGEPIDLYPYEGAELAVVGVAADDVLNVRTGPGTEFDVAFELEPLAAGLEATGHNRLIEGDGMWAEVTAEGGTGWVNVAFVSHLGDAADITTEVAPTPADLPSAPTMDELGEAVARTRASEEPPSTITVVDGPTVGDLGEITVDVVGLGDDAVGGERLHVFGTPDESGDGFTLKSVEATLLCTRGVSDGLCV
jgi:hypothetical protein